MALNGVEAFFFDVFGTVVNWHGTLVDYLQAEGVKLGITDDWAAFATEWRDGYKDGTSHVANGGSGTLNVDVMHREILDKMLSSARWIHIGARWPATKRDEVNLIWHKLNGWPDSTLGLYALKKHIIVSTLSNGNLRLLTDMAKHADLPWDVILSADLLGTFKGPSLKAYTTAAHHLSLPVHKCAMVAAHIQDLRAAAKAGMKTVYIRRGTEDHAERGLVRRKNDGGEVDVVVDSLFELVDIVQNSKGEL